MDHGTYGHFLSAIWIFLARKCRGPEISISHGQSSIIYNVHVGFRPSSNNTRPFAALLTRLFMRDRKGLEGKWPESQDGFKLGQRHLVIIQENM
jgi:hypothetical protein